MEFRVLGPVWACVDGAVVRVRGPKLCTLLAVLVVGGRRVVEVERIVGALWGDRPPGNARAAVQTHVSALRRSIGDVVVRQGDGYLLDVPEDRVDLWRWERLTREGGQALAAGRFAEARRSLAAALELCSGTPLGGAGGWWAEAERARLVDARVAAQEDLFDALLAVGDAAVPLPELVELVEHHPLRERLRAQLVLALGRAGRRSEALAAYQEGRRLLVEELGVEPGPVLRAAHRLALGDPAEPVATTRPVVVPGQLPPDLADFTGRTPEVAEVVGAVEGADTAVVAVSGQPGVGKSALAVHVAHLLRDRFPDGVLHACLWESPAAPLDPAEVLGRFLRALGVPGAAIPDSTPERTALYRSALVGRRVLVVLDDARDERQVRPLLPGGPGRACLITGRVRLTALEGVRHVDLGVLDEPGSLALLERLVGRERLASEPDRARELVRLCDHLPLAVRVAGARLAARPDWPLARLVDRLRRPREVLDELVAGDLEVRGSLAVSYAGLAEPERAALRALGWLGVPDFAASLVAVLLGVPVERAEDLVDALVRARLVDVAGVGGDGWTRYRLPYLTRAFALERGEREQRREDLLAMARRAEVCWAASAERCPGAVRVGVSRSAGAVDVPPGWSVAALVGPRTASGLAVTAPAACDGGFAHDEPVDPDGP